MIARRQIVLALGAGALVTPLSSFAQQPAKVWCVGVFAPGIRLSPVAGLPFLVRGQRNLGYVEGKNLVIEARYAEGDYGRANRGWAASRKKPQAA